MGAAHLVFLSGALEGSSYPLTGSRTVIGRVAGGLLVADDGEISSIHAMISQERDSWRVVDLGSTNGVYVNGKNVLDAALEHGSEVRLGRTRLAFVVTDAEDEETDSELPSLELDLDDETVPHGPRTDTVINLGAVKLLADRVAAEDRRTSPGVAVPTEPLPLVPPGPGPGVVVRLELLSGPNAPAVFEFHRDSIVLGRADADLEIPDSDVSRCHAVLEVFEDGHIFLRDRTSTNGTWIGDRRITSKRLAQNEIIRIGACRIRFTSRRIASKPRARRDGSRRR